MTVPRVAYEEIAHDRLMSLLSEHGAVEIELSRFDGGLIVALAKQHAILDDLARSRPRWLLDQVRLIYAIALTVLIHMRPRLSELRYFWVVSKATIGWETTSTKRYVVGFLGGRP